MIRPYKQSDQAPVLDLFEEVQRATQGLYPDQQIIDIKFGQGGMATWLKSGQGQRFVYQEQQQIIGHYQIERLCLDPEHAFPGLDPESLGLIQRLAVKPSRWSEGLGSQLTRDAIYRIQEMNLTPVVTCLAHRTHARAIYEKQGGVLHVEFLKPGDNKAVSYIFADVLGA